MVLYYLNFIIPTFGFMAEEAVGHKQNHSNTEPGGGSNLQKPK